MKGKSILDETQEERDLELSKLTNIGLDKIKSMELYSAKALNLNKKNISKNFESIYKTISPEFIKTLMFTSVNRRGKELIKLLKTTKNKKCLDYGTGVATHAIALLQNNNQVDILDVKGERLDFAKQRIRSRGFSCKDWNTTDKLPDSYYDLIICTNVLEHVECPLLVLQKIHNALKTGGQLHLLVSTMVNPKKGHFKSSIDEWKTKGQQFINNNFVTTKEKYLYIKK